MRRNLLNRTLPPALEDYRDILRKELRNRKRINPKYSLRDFAKHLGLTPSHLCEVMKNKKRLSEKTAGLITRNCNMPHLAARRFRYLTVAVSGRSLYKRNMARQGLKLTFMPKAKTQLREFIQPEKNLDTMIDLFTIEPKPRYTLQMRHRLLMTLSVPPKTKLDTSLPSTYA